MMDLALARLRSGREQALDRRAQIERELSLIEAKVHNLGEAIGAGRATDMLLDLLEAEGARKKTLIRELSGLHETAKVASLDALAAALDERLIARAVEYCVVQDRLPDNQAIATDSLPALVVIGAPVEEHSWSVLGAASEGHEGAPALGTPCQATEQIRGVPRVVKVRGATE
jgi:16S rRNA C1402 (ribose-2'-O) methylase RsmI